MLSDFESPLRLMVFDRSASGLGTVWSMGRRFYALRGLLDAGRGVASVDQALGWLATHGARRPIAEIQIWCHGKWGDVRFGAECLDRESLARASSHFDGLTRLRERLAPDALVWFRTCETFGAERGMEFAERFAEFMGARVAGHSYVIGLWQSGLHALEPGRRADWPADEGIAEGDARDPRRAKVSLPGEPNTISCFTGVLPAWAGVR
jgi:Domain of unknown function (DUF4347)